MKNIYEAPESVQYNPITVPYAVGDVLSGMIDGGSGSGSDTDYDG